MLHFCFVEILKTDVLFLSHFYKPSHFFYNHLCIECSLVSVVVTMDIYSNIAIDTMSSIYNKKPRGFQLDVITHIIKMMAGTIPKQPISMVPPTSAGKSAVPLTAAVVDGGITLIIENTLALGTDQASKIELIANSSPC